MTSEECRKANEEQKQKHYQQCTDDIYLLYHSFRRSGFDSDQAFELTATYVRQTMFDNVLREHIYKKDRPSASEMIKRYKEKL